jgi:hypothetical protein
MTDQNFNTGHCNSGIRNSGDRNTGHCNIGDRNTGHRNSGVRNSGDRNTGQCNTGHSNSGNCNSGHSNSGNCNSGHYNSGNCNSGYSNSGHCNSGYYNSCDHSSGFFCTETPKATFFDQPTDIEFADAVAMMPYVHLEVAVEFRSSDKMTDEEKKENPNHETIGGYLRQYEQSIQEAFPKAWAKMNDQTRQKFLDLPNFDAEKFKKCTGVDVTQNHQREAGRKVKIRLTGGEIVEGEIVE